VALKAAFHLTRPRQWPILTAQLLVGVLLYFSLNHPGESFSVLREEILWHPLLFGWLAWVVLLNGGTLAFNSAFDRDTGPVAYLPKPPPPPRHLATAMLLVMAIGALVGWVLVGEAFGATIGACLLLSVLYSHSRTRWKGIPGLDLLVNILGYGAGTTLGGLLIGAAMIPGEFPPGGIYYIFGFGLLFGSLYPATQIYQVHDDRLRGDRTLASAMGIKPSLVLAGALALAASTALLVGIYQRDGSPTPYFLLGGLGLWMIHIFWWWLRTGSMSNAQHERGMYRALLLWALIDATLLTEMLLR
jgi:lycopene elongase/hydratase (dihydrobisanhydrobacterioruberin-forming)